MYLVPPVSDPNVCFQEVNSSDLKIELLGVHSEYLSFSLQVAVGEWVPSIPCPNFKITQ